MTFIYRFCSHRNMNLQFLEKLALDVFVNSDVDLF